MSVLRTERLDLRLYAEPDKLLMISLFTDERVMKHVGNGVMTVRAAEKLWDKLLNEFYPEGKDTIWGMFARDDGRYVGHASLRPRPPIPEDWEVGYMLRTEEWGKGFATEVCRALVDLGFEEFGLENVFATVDDEHRSSIRVLRKCGFEFHSYDYDEQGRYSVYAANRAKRSPPAELS